MTVIFALLPPTTEARADGKETLDAARAAYYSLYREGLAGFTCLATPNWDPVLASLWRTDPVATEKTYKEMSALTFGVEVTSGQPAKVSHTDPPGGIEKETVKRVVSGVERVLRGVVDAWTPFAIGTMIPPTGEVTEAHGLWIVEFKGTTLPARLVMRRDYTIESIHTVTPNLDRVLQPQFERSPKGLVLTALQGSYRTLPSGATSSLQLRFEYQDVSGFMLPKRAYALSNDGQRVWLMDLSFGTCQAQRRP